MYPGLDHESIVGNYVRRCHPLDRGPLLGTLESRHLSTHRCGRGPELPLQLTPEVERISSLSVLMITLLVPEPGDGPAGASGSKGR